MYSVLSSEALDGVGAVPSVADKAWEQETLGGVQSVADKV